MENDFISYGVDPKSMHKIVGGTEKDEENVTIKLMDDTTLLLRGSEIVKVINNGKTKSILAKELTEDDEIDDTWIEEYRRK
tara:strand:- start:219 stop:461 length:243 start_codon:yes stop_codon:yes gene_type:complete